MDALEHQEVIEIPEDDLREPHAGELGGSLLEALGLEPVEARGLEQVARVAAVARDAALLAKLGKGNVPTEVGEHDPQRGGDTLDGLELQDQRRPLRALTPAHWPSSGLRRRASREAEI
ncbi:hypothetical protein D3C86_1153310 [compost metagenome]